MLRVGLQFFATDFESGKTISCFWYFHIRRKATARQQVAMYVRKSQKHAESKCALLSAIVARAAEVI